MWRQLNREGIPVARCTIAHLMEDLELAGAERGRRFRTTIPLASAARPFDLVEGKSRPRPNRLWVSDLTCVATWRGRLRRFGNSRHITYL